MSPLQVLDSYSAIELVKQDPARKSIEFHMQLLRLSL
jgi:hypothetical protein